MGLFDRWRRPQVWAGRQMDRGLSALAAGKPKTALRIATVLHRMGYAGAFELEARAHEALGAADTAISTAESGVRQFPRDARLWNALGTLYSHQGRFDRAIKALDRALRCADVDADNVRFNRAIALWQAGQPEEALTDLAAFQPEVTDLHLSCLALRMAILNEAQRWDEAIVVGEALPAADTEAPYVDLARGKALAQLARAWWHGRTDRKRARSLAVEAVEADRQNRAALEIVRLIDDKQSDGAVWGTLEIEGTWPQPMGRRQKMYGFRRQFEVVARHGDEALSFAKLFLPPGSRAGATVASWDPAEPAPGDRMGVYETTGYRFFPR
jgi:tetratricopeptide (TPR) repeat protein